MNKNALLAFGAYALIVSFLLVIIAEPAGTITLVMLGLIALTALAMLIPITMEHHRRMRLFAVEAQKQ